MATKAPAQPPFPPTIRRPLVIDLSDGAYVLVNKLLRRGLYGSTPAEVVERLLDETLRTKFVEPLEPFAYLNPE